MQYSDISNLAKSLQENVSRVIVGKSREIELVLTALFSGSGEQITAQLPGPETALEAGSQVLLYLDEAAPQAVTVPDLTGMTPAQANEAAAKAGVTLRFSGNPDFEQAILVQFQDIAAGTSAEPGCTVTVTFTDPSARD